MTSPLPVSSFSWAYALKDQFLDFSAPSLDGFVPLKNNENSSQSLPMENKLVLNELMFDNKQDGSDDFNVQNTMMFGQNRTPLLRSNSMVYGDTPQQGLVSNFSSLRPEVTTPISKDDDGFAKTSFRTYTGFAYYHSPSAYARNIGTATGNMDISSTNKLLSGIRAPFTPSQWMELQHQNLIFKYISAGLSVPPYMLGPPLKSGYPSLSGWNNLHLNYFNNTADSEPGRCRRTDGKKWRCAKEVVPDKKYCERHLNRGRHRSRKPVEGQTVCAAAATSETTNSKLSAAVSYYSVPFARRKRALNRPKGNCDIKLHDDSFSANGNRSISRLRDGRSYVEVVSATTKNTHLDVSQGEHISRRHIGAATKKKMPLPSVAANGGASNSLVITHQKLKNIEPADGALVNSCRQQDPSFVSMLSSTMNQLKPDNSAFIISKQNNPISQSEIGVASYYSVSNPAQVSYMKSKNSESFLSFNDQETQDQQLYPLGQFTNNHYWPKDQFIDQSTISWLEEMKSDCTQLSMSIPLSTSEFSLSSYSTIQDKTALSPLGLSHEVDPIRMGLRMSGDMIWGGTSTGGPLGEVLINNNGSTQVLGYNNSPNGVLEQKETCGSVLNDSTSSSNLKGKGKMVYDASII